MSRIEDPTSYLQLSFSRFSLIALGVTSNLFWALAIVTGCGNCLRQQGKVGMTTFVRCAAPFRKVLSTCVDSDGWPVHTVDPTRLLTAPIHWRSAPHPHRRGWSTFWKLVQRLCPDAYPMFRNVSGGQGPGPSPDLQALNSPLVSQEGRKRILLVVSK